ncbi:MAG TPA: hypothetical protein VIE65_07340 [Methylobacter sp.]|jgi:outer membrane protein assembly factor BamB
MSEVLGNDPIILTLQTPALFFSENITGMDNLELYDLDISNVSSECMIASLCIEWTERAVPNAIWFRPEDFDRHAVENTFRTNLINGPKLISSGMFIDNIAKFRSGGRIILALDREEPDAMIKVLVRPSFI